MAKKLRLSPMLVQYLAGLCAMKWPGAPASLNVTFGDMVYDQASDTERDVDVTVTFDTPDGVYGFRGYEVKHWASKLDQSHVEALNAKFADMPSVTHKAIVCTSGYTKQAIKKAEYHGVELFVLKEWTTPIEKQFPNLAPMKGVPAQVFKGGQFSLIWSEYSFWLEVDLPEFHINDDGPLFDSEGRIHPIYRDFANFSDDMATQSTDLLFPLKQNYARVEPLHDAMLADEPIPELPSWPYAHTIDTQAGGVYVRTPENTLHQIYALTISGQLCWKHSPLLYCAMENAVTGEVLAGAVVADSPAPGRMWAFIFPTKGQTIDIRSVVLSRQQRNILRQLKLPTIQVNTP